MKLKKISTPSRNKRSLGFIATLFGCLGILVAVYVGAFFFQFGAPVSSMWWMRNVLYIKEYIAQNSDGDRIIIISGSNSLLGIDSALLEHRTGRPVVNLALSGLLGMPYMVYLLEKHLKPGDTIVMPLEADFYETPVPFYTDYVNNVLAWGDDHWMSLNLTEKAMIFFKTSPWRVLHGIDRKLSNPKANPLKTLTREQALQNIHQVWNAPDTEWKEYSYKSVNRNGDILVDPKLGQTEQFHKEYNWGRPYYTKINESLSNGFLSYYKRIKSLAEDREAELFLTWSVTTKNRFFNLDKKPRRRKLQNFVDLLQKYGIPIHCNPIHFNFSPEFFFDTMHHLNSTGARMRTENLADCMLSENQGLLTSSIDFEGGFAHVKLQEASARKDLDNSKRSP